MAGTGGKEVGKVSIRVVPDLDEFRNKLRAELEKWERDPRQIKVKADVSDFRSDIENAARGLTAEVDVDAQTGGLRREIERATDGVSSTVDVNARVESGELAKSLRDQISELNSRVINLSAKPELDPGDIAKLKADIQRVRDLKAKIGVDVDAAKAINDLQDAARGLTLSSSEPIEFDDLDVNPDKAVKKTKDAFKGFKVKFPVEPESEGLDRFQRRLLAQVQSAAAKLDAKIPLDAEGEGFRREVNDLVKAAVAKVTAKIPVELSDAADVRLEAAQLVNEIQSLADDGDVRVAVSPDLDRFQKRYLSKIQSFLAEAEANLPLTVDGENLRRQITKEAAILESRVKAINVDADPIKDLVRALNSIDVENRIQLDDRDFQASIVRARAEADKVLAGLEAQVGVEPSIDNGKLSSAVAKLRAALSGFSVDVDTDIGSVQVSADTDRLRSEVAAAVRDFTAVVDVDADAQGIVDLRREIDGFYRRIRDQAYRTDLLTKEAVADAKRNLGLLKQQVDVTVDLKTAKADFEFQAFLARKSLQELEVTLRPKVDRVSWSSAFRSLSNSLEDGLATVTDKLGGLANFSRRFSAESIITGVAIVGAVAALAAPAVALLSGALLALPAALAAIVAPAGVVALGVEGIKKAAETAKPAFDDLRQSIADVFASPEKGMIRGFEQIRDRLIPGIKIPLQGIAESISTLFNDTINTLSSGEGLNNLQRTFDNIGAAIRAASPGVQSFTDGLTTLVAKLSNGFPGLAESFNRIGAEFSAWIDKVSSNGQLDQAMKSLGGTLREIGGAVKDIAQWGFENLADPAFGDKMRQFAADLRSIINDLLPLLKSGFQDIASIINGIVSAIDKVKGASKTFEKYTNFSPIPDDKLLNPNNIKLEPSKDVSKGWVSVLFGSLGAEIERVWGSAGQQAKGSFEQGWLGGGGSFDGQIGSAVANQIKQAVQVSAEDQKQALKSAFTAGGVDSAVSQQLTQQVQAAVQGAKNAMASLGPELQSAIDNALIPLASIADRVGQAFSTMGPTINQAFIAAMAGVKNTVTGLFAFLVLSVGTQTSQLSNSIAQGFNGLPAAIGGAMSALRGVISSSLGGITDAFGQAFAGAAGRVSSALTGVTAAVSQAMAASAQAAATGVTGILQVLQAGLAAAPQVVQAIFGSIPAVVQGAMAPAITAVSTICQQMVSTALAFAGAMQSAGQSIGASFAAGIASSEGLVRGAASALLDAARGFFPSSPAKEGPFSGSGWVDKSGVAVGEAFAGGIQDSVGGVVNIAKVLMQQVKDVFGNAEGVVFNFNFGGVNSGLERTASSLGAVQNQLGSFSSSAQEFQSSFGQGVLPQLSGPESKQQLRDLSQQLAELEIVRKSLELQKVPGADNSLVKAQLEQIRLRKLELGLQKNQLEYSNKYGASQNAITDAYGQQIKDLASMPMDFGRAVGDQFMSDLGFGNGALPTVANELLNWGSQIVFNVSNMDDALMGQKRFQNQQSAAMIGR